MLTERSACGIPLVETAAIHLRAAAELSTLWATT
jgi:hypothetical protein